MDRYHETDLHFGDRMKDNAFAIDEVPTAWSGRVHACLRSLLD